MLSAEVEIEVEIDSNVYVLVNLNINKTEPYFVWITYFLNLVSDISNKKNNTRRQFQFLLWLDYRSEWWNSNYKKTVSCKIYWNQRKCWFMWYLENSEPQN